MSGHTGAIRRAATALARGGVVAYPTEAVFGLGCDPRNGPAFGRLLRVKGRSVTKGVILIAAEFAQLQPYLDPAFRALWHVPLQSWPGPVTWVIPARRSVPQWLTGGRRTVAVRVTAHAIAAQLCRAFGGPIVSTSANRSGAAPLRDPCRVRLALGRSIDAVLCGTVGGRSSPTEIRDVTRSTIIRSADADAPRCPG